MKTKWTAFANKQLAGIYKYHEIKANEETAKKVVSELVIRSRVLQSQPKIGPVEELLSGQPQQFRYLVHGNYKIIYWINNIDNQVEITDVFDTRQDPKKLNRST